MSSTKSLFGTLPRLGLLAALVWPLGVGAVLTVPETPLFLTSTGVPPNVLVTLDDSGSMQWAFMPDNQSNTSGTRRSKSSTFNPIYYNPNVIYTPPIGANGVALATTFNNAWNNGFDQSRGSVNLNSNYRHTWTYDPSVANFSGWDYNYPYQNPHPSADFGNTTAGVRAYYYNFVPSNPGCNGTATDEDCYTRVNVTSAADMQNFANWYSFYRTRNLATVSAASIAFGMFAPETRLAWQSLNSCPDYGSSSFVTNDCDGWQNLSPTISNAIKPLGASGASPGQHRINFYKWLHRLPASGGTPLRTAFERAGAYLETSGASSPWDNDLEAGGLQGEATCRKSFSIIMTDGMWNGDSDNFHGNVDNAAATLPDGTAYGSPKRPYSDSNGHSLADIAMYYWRRDLRPTLANEVPKYMPVTTGTETERYWNPANDPATWQHMTTYTVGLGLTPALQSTGLTWSGNMYGGSYANLVSGATNWPAVSSNSTNNPSDLWHAAINGRGRFYSADDPNALVQAFSEIVNSISAAASAGGGAGVALSSATIEDLDGTATTFVASYRPDYGGKLEAKEFLGATGLFGQTYWDAATRIPVPADRKIFTFSGGAARNMTSCDAALNTAFGNATCAAKLAWLRGDFSQELRRGGPYRNRAMEVQALPLKTNTTLYPDSYKVGRCVRRADGTFYSNSPAYLASLGNSEIFDCPWQLADIINSDLIYSPTPQEDFGYANPSVTFTGHDTYAAYVTNKQSRTPVVYGGANDGMLHAFRADIGNIDSGKELFAFVPGAVYPKLNALTEPGYTHKFYVNGPATIGDAYVGGQWRTYLVGGLGAGGKSIYALDVTNPTGFSVSDVKWEFTDTQLGLTYGRAQIAPVNVGGNVVWAAIFGNGYNSAADNAYLYVVNLSSGALIARLATNNETANGLATPYLYDSDGDKVIDYVYAGDLRGNLWQFKLTGSWTSGTGSLLFTARNASNQIQPITSPPSVFGPHPNGGVIVMVGTGSYITANDLTNSQQQSFYGIWVQNPNSPTTVTRAQLQQQTINSQQTGGGFTWRVVSKNDVAWATKKGWYLDMPLPSPLSSPSERIVSPSLVIDQTPDTFDRVLFTTVIPSGDPCKQGGTGWLMELNVLTGGQPGIPVLDFNSDGDFDRDDVVGASDSNNDGTISYEEAVATGNSMSGMQLTSIGVPGTINTVYYTGHETTPGTSFATKLYKMVSGSAGTVQIHNNAPGGSNPAAGNLPATRIYWQQIM